SSELPGEVIKGSSAEEIRALSEKLRAVQETGGSNQRMAAAMANLADGISGLVKNMRSEQQIMRDWVEAQSDEQKELRATLDRIAESLKSRESL
ncbi:MAG: flagellar motor protein MotA, partial [Rhizobiaceae bacterium]